MVDRLVNMHTKYNFYHINLPTNEGNHICIMTEISKNALILLIEHGIRIVENPIVRREEGIIRKIANGAKKKKPRTAEEKKKPPQLNRC